MPKLTTTASATDTANSSHVWGRSGQRNGKNSAPNAAGGTSRSSTAWPARPRSVASIAACRSHGRPRSTTTSPVRTRRASSWSPHSITTLIRPWPSQT